MKKHFLRYAATGFMIGMGAVMLCENYSEWKEKMKPLIEEGKREFYNFRHRAKYDFSHLSDKTRIMLEKRKRKISNWIFKDNNFKDTKNEFWENIIMKLQEYREENNSMLAEIKNEISCIRQELQNMPHARVYKARAPIYKVRPIVRKEENQGEQ